MSALLRTKLFWCFSLLCLLGTIQGQQAAHAALNVVVTSPGALTTDSRPTITVNVTGATGADTLTLSLLDSGGGPVVNGAVLTSAGTNTNNVDDVTAGAGTVAYTFTAAHITKPGSYKLRAVLAGTDSFTGLSAAFNVTVGAAAQLAFAQQPTDTVVNVNFSPLISVQVEDADGNLVTSASNFISLTIGNNPGGAFLNGNVGRAAAGGVATFAADSLTKVGTGYTLVATSTGLTSATSTAFNITPGPAAKVVFGQQPANTVAGAVISPAVTVKIEDASGNVVTTNTSAVTLAIGTNPGGSTLGGTLTVNAVAGIATFSDLSLNKVGTGYTLTAADGALTGATSTGFDITSGPAASLSFTQSPANAAVGATLTTTKVLVLDAAGNPKSGAAVTLTLAGPAATLGGTLTVNTNGSGIAVFSDLTVNATGTFQLVGATPGGGGTTITGNSTIFAITAGAPAQLAFGQPPGGATAGANIFPAVTVLVEDAAGNVTTSGANVTLSIATGPAGAKLNGVVGGTVTVAAANGVATFNTLALDKVGAYTLTAASAGLTSVTSGSFPVTPGPAATVTLALPSPATGLTTDSTFTLTATVKDSQGNPVADGALATLALSSGGAPGVVLTGGTANTSGGTGTALFSVNINKPGTYSFKATSGGVTSAAAGPLTISAGAAATLTFTRQPGSAGAGQTLTPAVTVLVKDANGNVVPGAAVTLTLAGTPTAGGTATLGGTLTQTANSSGVATFADLSVDKVGTAYTLTASTGSAVPVTSNVFAVTAGAAAAPIVLSNPPATKTADESFALTATVKDAQGNPVVDGTPVTLAFTNSDGSPVSAGTALTGGAANTAGGIGVATFTVNINKTGRYKFTATSGAAVTAAPTTAIQIVAGVAATVSFAQQPTSTAAAAAITPAVAVLVKDTNGNAVPGASVSLALSGSPTAGGTAALGGTTHNADGTVSQVTDANGLATYSDLKISQVGTAYTLTATTGSAAPVTSGSFAITPGPIVLLFTAQPPATSVSGAPFSVSVSLLDGSGNPIPNAPVALTLTQGAGTLAGTAAQNTDATGHLTFNGLRIDKAGADKQLTATATVGGTSYTAVTTPAFAITPGAAAALKFTGQPPASVTDPTTAFGAAVQVFDAGGNLVADSPTTTVTLSLSGSVQATLNGVAAQSTSSGTATFRGLSVSAPGTYQLTAAAQTSGASSSAAPVVSTSFTVGNPPSRISRLTTDVGNVHAGDPTFTLTIIGSGFVPGAVVTFAGNASVLADPKATPLVTNVSVSSDGTQITATIAASLVVSAGDPVVTVVNPGTNPAAAGKLNFLVYPLGPVADTAGNPHTDATAQYFNPGLQLFSVPFDYTTDADGTALLVGDVLRAFQVNPAAALGGTITDENVLPTLAVWDPVTNGYVLTSGSAVPVFSHGITADSLVLGQGYWGRFQFHPAADPTRQAGLALRGVAAADLTGTRKLNGQPFSIPLQTGWNMIGDPFTGTVSLSLMQVQAIDAKGSPLGPPVSLTAASDAGLAGDFFYKYVAGTGYVPVTPAGVLLPGGAPASSDNKLTPYVGYWVFAYQACHLLIPSP